MYTIGIGALIQGSAFNRIRQIELDVAQEINNSQGLAQPPHVTVKRPFEVADVAAIKKTGELIHAIALHAGSFELTLNGIGYFADKVWYVGVQPNDALQRLHKSCLDALTPLFPDCKSVFEGEKMVFHSTLAMDITPEQFMQAGEYLQSQPQESYNITTRVTQLGLFLGMASNTHWVVIDQVELGKGDY